MSQLFTSDSQSFHFSSSPSNEYSGLISFGIDWFDVLAVQGTLRNLLPHHNSKASILRPSTFFMVQLSHLYMTTGKTIALTILHCFLCTSPLTYQFSSVAHSCPTLFDPMNCSTPDLTVHHQLPESTQTQVHQVGDAIQPSHPLSSPSPATHS